MTTLSGWWRLHFRLLKRQEKACLEAVPRLRRHKGPQPPSQRCNDGSLHHRRSPEGPPYSLSCPNSFPHPFPCVSFHSRFYFRRVSALASVVYRTSCLHWVRVTRVYVPTQHVVLPFSTRRTALILKAHRLGQISGSSGRCKYRPVANYTKWQSTRTLRNSCAILEV